MRLRPSWLIVIALALLWAPLAIEAQPPRRPQKIAVLHRGFFPINPSVEGLTAGLKAEGMEEGRDVIFDIRFTRGNLENAPAIAAELANSGADLIFVDDEETARAVIVATKTIPIIFTQVGDPVAAGIVREIAHPGGNITGVSNLATELVGKRLEILKAMVPTLRRVWLVYHADDRSSVAVARKAREVAQLLKLELVARPVRSSEELVGQLKTLRTGDGVLSPDSRILNIPGLVLDLVLLGRVPAVFDSAFWVQAGGLASYGSEEKANAAQAARLVARILRGTRPPDPPLEGAHKIELAANLKTAKALGLTIPQSIRIRADHVIQ